MHEKILVKNRQEINKTVEMKIFPLFSDKTVEMKIFPLFSDTKRWK